MKKLLTALSVAAVLLVAAAPAQAVPGFGTGIDVAVNIPTGDWEDVSGMAVGALGYISFDAVPIIKVTARAGYLHGLENNGASISHVPVLAGVKWFPVPVFYLAGELGMVWSKAKFDPGPVGKGESDWESEIGGTIGVGAGLGPLDARISLFMPDFDEVDNLKGILLTAGYRF